MTTQDSGQSFFMRAAFDRVDEAESSDGPTPSSSGMLCADAALCRDRAPPPRPPALGISSASDERADSACELFRSSVCANGEESVRLDDRCDASALRFGPISDAGGSPLPPPPPLPAANFLAAGDGDGDGLDADGRGGRLVGMGSADLWTGAAPMSEERAGAMETALGFGLAAPSPNAAATSANSASSNLENMDLRLRRRAGTRSLLFRDHHRSVVEHGKLASPAAGAHQAHERRGGGSGHGPSHVSSLHRLVAHPFPVLRSAKAALTCHSNRAPSNPQA